MKRILVIILSTVLLLSALAACGTTPAETTPMPTTPASTTPAPTTPAPTTPTPTTPVVTTPADTTPIVTTPPEPTYPPIGESPYTIEQLYAWGITPVGSFACEDGYLGTYNNYAVYACKSAFSGSKIKEIGGTKFLWGEPYAIACKNGFVFELKTAYHRNILSSEDLSAIAYYWYGGQSFEQYEHVSFYENAQGAFEAPYPPLGESPYTYEQLCEWEVFPSGCCQSVSGYLGTYNGYSVYSSQGEIRSSAIEEIGGVEFWWGEAVVIVCKDGEKYSLKDACERNILRTEDLRAIAYYLYGNIPLREYGYPIFHGSLHGS